MSFSDRRKHTPFVYYRRLRKLVEFVNSHSDQRIPAAKAAEVVGLNKSYFSTYFRRKTGICYKDWLAQIRVQKAMALIQNENYTITEVCFSVGYSDMRAFERAFKRYIGMTPAEYKKSVRP